MFVLLLLVLFRQQLVRSSTGCLQSLRAPSKVINFTESVNHEDVEVGGSVEQIAGYRDYDLPNYSEAEGEEHVDDVDSYSGNHHHSDD